MVNDKKIKKLLELLGSVRLSTPVLTPLHCGSRLGCKERRNSSNSGTHLRQAGGFFVPMCLVGATDAMLRREGGEYNIRKGNKPAVC